MVLLLWRATKPPVVPGVGDQEETKPRLASVPFLSVAVSSIGDTLNNLANTFVAQRQFDAT
jgi:hypothetical protein